MAIFREKGVTAGAGMTQEDQKPTANTPMSDRGHSDPPGLWTIVVLSSLVIHLFVLGMLRLWLMVRISSFQNARNLIPVDIIAQASEASFPFQPTPTTTSVAPTNLPSVNTSTPDRQTASTSLHADSPKTNTSSGVTPPGKQNPSPKQSPTVRKSPATNPSQKPSSGTPTQKPSPAPISSQNNQSGTQTSSSKPDSSNNKGNETNGSSTSPSPSPVASNGSGGNPNSSDSQSGGILISSIGTPDPIPNNGEILHPNDPNYNDKLASLSEGNSQLSAAELKPVGITLKRDLVLRVVVIIESTGKATFVSLPPQELPGNLSAEQAKQLANKSIAKLRFSPTLMAGKPVDRDYTLTLKISPSQK